MRVGWVRDRNRDFATSAADAEAYAKALEAYNNDPKKHQRPELPDAQIFSMVVKLSGTNFRMQANARWDKNDRFTKKLKDLKLSALADPPEPAVFKSSGDFEHFMSNMLKLVESKRTPGWTAVNGIFDKELTGENLNVDANLRVKFKHHPWEPKPKSDPTNDNGEVPEEDAIPFEFTLEGWPRDNDDITKELEEMKNTHRANPIPAFDTDGQLIRPCDYEAQLREALVVVRFTLSHWSIGKPKDQPAKPETDSYSADVVNISVLIPPPPRAAGSPPRTKLKRFSLTNPVESPTKKSRRT